MSDDVAVFEQQEIEVFVNGMDPPTITIRQHRWPEEDPVILVRPENVARLCAALMRAAESIGPHDENPVLLIPAPSSSAEKQRRYRQRQRQRNSNGAECYPEGNAVGNGPVLLASRALP